MPFRRFAFEDVVRAAIRADDIACFGYVEKDARMARPKRRAWQRAVQGQVMCAEFDDFGDFACFRNGVFSHELTFAEELKRTRASLRAPALCHARNRRTGFEFFP